MPRVSASSVVGLSGLGIVLGLATGTSAASANVTKIQAALDVGGPVSILSATPVTYYVNAPLVIGGNTHLHLSPTVTIRQAPGTNGNLLNNFAYRQVWNAMGGGGTGGVSWTAGNLTATYNLPSHGLVVGDAVWIRNSTALAVNTDSAFIGVFYVLTVTDANNVVCVLRRLPAALTVGTVQWKKVDQNVSVEGGIWDHNYPTNDGGATATDRHAIILAGVRNLHVQSIRVAHAVKFCLCVAGIATGTIEDVEGVDTNSDILKIYGPSFDVEASGITGDCGDDAASIHTEESQLFSAYDFAHGGDCINVWVRRVNVTRGYGVAVYPINSSLWMDDIGFEDVNMYAHYKGGAVQTQMVRVNNTGLTTGQIGTLTFRRVEQRIDFGAAGGTCIAVQGTATNIHQLIIDGFRGPKVAGTLGGPYVVVGAAAGTVNKLVIRGASVTMPPVAGTFLLSVTSGIIVKGLTVEDCDVRGSNNGFGAVVQLNVAGLSTVDVRNCRVKQIAGVVTVQSAVTSTPVITLDNNDVETCIQLVSCAGSAKVHLARQRMDGSVMTNGVIRGSGTAAITLTSGGGNLIPAGKVWIVGSGTPTLTLSGHCADVAIDLSLTGVARADGAIAYNTNAALGTLGAAGLVVGQGTASGSWHLLADPTKVY